MRRNIPAACVGAVLLVALGAASVAETKCIWIDERMDKVMLIAEVEVIDVHPMEPEASPQTSAATVRVTGDIARVFKGFDWMKRTLKVSCDEGSPSSFGEDMKKVLAEKRTVLLVVRKDRSVILKGLRSKTEDGADAYDFNGWYDFNAVIIESRDIAFGSPANPPLGNCYRVPAGQLRERYAQEAQAFRARGAAWLLVQPGAPDEALAAAIAKLDSEDFAEREDATKALAARGEALLPALAAARERAKSQEVRTRLDEVLNANFEASGAYHWAQRVKAEGARAEAALLLEYSKTPRVPSEPLLQRLGELAKAEKLGVPERADLDALKAAWTKALSAEANAHVQPGKSP